jgi:hypothetical protein
VSMLEVPDLTLNLSAPRRSAVSVCAEVVEYHNSPPHVVLVERIRPTQSMCACWPHWMVLPENLRSELLTSYGRVN